MQRLNGYLGTAIITVQNYPPIRTLSRHLVPRNYYLAIVCCLHLLLSSNALADLSGIQKVVTGSSHSCALLTSGGLECWGRNFYGQLGDGTTKTRNTPVAVTGQQTGIAVVSLGEDHTCAVTTSGAVKCWGRNTDGQLGNSTNINSYVPVDVTSTTSGAITVTTGFSHNCVLTTAGSINCWGYNFNGQLGDSTTTARNEPVGVAGLSSGIERVVAGNSHTCAITTSGALKCWGWNAGGLLGAGINDTNSPTPRDVVGLSTGVSNVAPGRLHSCALMTSGTLKCWGWNYHGQLGDGTRNNRETPVNVVGLAGSALRVSVGEKFSCALISPGSVQCWGAGELGKLGNGTTDDSTTPTNVIGLVDSVIAISSASTHSCATTSSFTSQCWGYNVYAQLGNGGNGTIYSPVDVYGVSSGAMLVSVGGGNTCLILTSGSLSCMGSNPNGQVGDNTVTNRYTPTNVVGLSSGASNLAVGGGHTCALTTDSGVKCWGYNFYNALGDGTSSHRSSPVSVLGLSDGVNKVDTGKDFSCALTSAGGVKCWGRNNLGQLGDGTTTNRSSPVDVSGLTSGVSDISVGHSHSCAIVADGKLKCWGLNTSSQLGDGTTATYTTPIDAVAVSTEYVVTVGAGNAHTCVKTSSDNMLCWGSNSSGKLGDGTATQRATPVAVNGLGRVATIAVGDSHTCATTTDGAAKCWGYNGGRLGDGLATSSSTPRAVLGLDSGVIQLSAGEINTCAITSGGGLKCWGGNTYGAVGASPPTLTTVKSSRRFSGTARLSGMPLDGVTMAITGMGPYYPQTSIDTDADGTYGLYTCEGVPFVLTPSKVGYQFTPGQITGNASSDFTQDFVATAIPYNITGTVTATGTPLAGVSIDGGSLGTQITDGGGAYSFTGVGFGTSYTLTPSLANYEFTPADSSGTVSGDVIHDFAAVYNPSVTTTTSVAVTTTTVPTTTTEPTTTAETTSVATTTVESSSTILALTTTVATTSTVAPSTTVATTTIPVDLTDSDNDDVTDSEELTAGTNPNDPGSKAPKLRSKLCSDWNGYLSAAGGRGMYNIMEHINRTTKKIRVKTELRNIGGHLKDTYEFFLRGNQQFDLLVHDMEGREVNSYGQVCSTYERAPAGGVDGRMVYYKYGDAGDMQFAFALPFEDPLRGTSGLLFNTKQPSLDPQDSSNLVANWVQLSNVSKKRLKGTLTFYSLEGTALGSYSVDLRDGARYDYPGHAWGSQAGLARFVPENSTVDYQLRAVRYLYDNADGRDSFTTAYPFGAAVGSGETLIAPVDTSSTSSAAVLTDLQSNSAILELSNTLNKKVAVALNLYDNTGKKLLYSKTHSLKAYSALHLPLDTLLLNSTGLLTAKSSHSGSIIGSVVHYGRVASGGLINLYAVPLREPVGTVFKGSYNTYLNQGCSLYLGNSATSKEKVTVTLRQNDGTSPVSSYSLTVPGRGLLTDNVCAKSQNDTYGVVTVTATKSKRITGLLLRVGERGRYKIATEMR